MIRTIAMPADTNPAGDIFGGWLMAQMDLDAGNVAARRARGRCATIAVEGMTFLQPVVVGDEASLHAHVVSVGRSSIRIQIEAWRRARSRSRRKRAISAAWSDGEATGLVGAESGAPAGRRCGEPSISTVRHWRSMECWIPSSAVICICDRPPLSSRSTALRSNSGVNSHRVFAIKHLPRP
ncbi:Thioesterase superfamily protein [Methylobacterium sp. ap11]|nr:Thioesterase superfamily protein [Methylobacterium sp. ap11]